MKKSTTKLLSAILAVVMLLTGAVIAPDTVTADAVEVSAEPRTNVWPNKGDISSTFFANEYNSVKYTYSPSERTLTITGKGRMRDFGVAEFDSRPWADAEVIIIDNGVKTIGSKAFMNCFNLKLLFLPDGLTEIGESAFSHCTSLSDVSLPSCIEKMGTSVFNGCDSLNTIDIPLSVSVPNVNAGVNSGSMFYKCKNISVLNVPGGFETIGEKFASGCEFLQTVYIMNGPTAIESDAFSNCGNLLYVIIPQSVKSIEKSAFTGLSKNFCIYGYPDSYAYLFAQENNINFVDISDGIPQEKMCRVLYYLPEEHFDPSTHMRKIQVLYNTKSVRKGGMAYNIEAPVRTGYSFCGWYENENCVGVPYNFEVNRVYDTLSLYGKYCATENEHKTINFNSDIFYFKNEKCNLYLNNPYYDILYSQASLVEKLDLRFNRSNNAAVCFGMSSILVLSKMGRLDLSKFGFSCVADIIKPSADTESVSAQLINYYHRQQRIGKTKEAREGYSSNQSVNIQNLLSKLVNYNEPILFTLNLASGSGHACVAYDWEVNNNNEFLVNYWDSNYPGEECQMHIASDFSSVELVGCPSGGFIKSSLLAENTIDSVSLQNELIDSGYLKNSTAADVKQFGLTDNYYTPQSDSYFTTSYQSFTIKSSNGKSAKVIDCTFVSGDSDIVECLGPDYYEGEEPAYLFRVPDPTNGVSYTIIPSAVKGAKEYTTKFESKSGDTDGFASTAKTASVGSVTINSKGEVSTSTAEAVQQSAYTVVNSTTNTWATSVFSGVTTGITVTPDGNDTVATSKSATTLKVETMDALNSVVQNVEVAANGTAKVSESRRQVVLTTAAGSKKALFPYTASFVTGTAEAVEIQTDLQNGDLIEKPFVEKIGYTAEWFKNANFTGTPWDFANGKITDDITLYAKWTANSQDQCKLSFYSDGVLTATTNIMMRKSNLTLAPAPEKPGYIFTGWYLDEECMNPVMNKTKFVKDKKLYAGWKQIGKLNAESADKAKVFGSDGEYDEFGLSGLQMKIPTDGKTEATNGLRFCITVGKNLFNNLKYLYGDTVEYGALVALKKNTENISEIKIGSANTTELTSKTVYYTGTEYNVATVLVRGISAPSYSDEIVVRPFVKYKDRNGNEQIYYVTETQANSVHAKGYCVSMYKAARFILDNDSASFNKEQIAYLQSVVNVVE